MSVKDSLRALSSALGAESEAKSIKGILRDICVLEEAEGTGRTVADLIMEIAVAKGYEPSTDEETQSEPEYVYTAVEEPSGLSLSSYYERSGESEPYTYTLTTDTEIDPQKTYYTRTLVSTGELADPGPSR